MTAPIAPPAAPTDEGRASSFDNDVAQLFGDFVSIGDETPPETESAEGTTPLEPAVAGEPPVDDAALGTPADLSAGTTPVATAAPDDDPFKGTSAATYIVNGQPIASEDIRVFKEGGAVIRPEALPNVLSQLAERATLQTRLKASEQQYQTTAKVVEWHDQASGKTYTGPEAAIEMRIGNAALLAENKLLVDVLMDPQRLASILTTRQVADGRGGLREEIIISPAALATLQRENALTQRELAQAIRTHYQGVMATAAAPEAQPVNYEVEGPRLMQTIAAQANLDPAVLTPEDRKLLVEQIPFHVQKGLVSVAWQNLVKATIASRTAARASTQAASKTAEAATREGQARMAAAARGVRQTPRPAASAPPPVKPVNERAQNESDAWDAMERASAAALRSTR